MSLSHLASREKGEILSVEVIVQTGISLSHLASRDEEWAVIPDSYIEVSDIIGPSGQHRRDVKLSICRGEYRDPKQ